MLGWFRWGEGRKIRLEQDHIRGLPVMVLYLPERMRGRERRVRKGASLLAERRVTRVLVPPGFDDWPLLMQCGLRPVDTQALRCALAPEWVKTVLAGRGITAQRAVLLLTGARESPDMAQVARALCPIVRNLVIDVPNGGVLASSLRREYGLPVLPARATREDLTLSFEAGPLLEGAKYGLRGAELPADCEILPLLSVLWECGRVKTEDILLKI